jgi:DNA-binding NarL/FixJ family response regulator
MNRRRQFIKVLLADDHPVVRIGIRSLIEDSGDLKVVGEAVTGREALNFMKTLFPDVLILDMNLPDMDGIDVIQEMRVENINMPVLALSAHDDEEYVNALIDGGLAGYVVKEEAPEMLVSAVRAVANGEKGWISRRIMDSMTIRKYEKDNFSRLGLTKREYEVLKIIAHGKTNQEIALTLGISEKTVERHIQGVYSKLGVVSRVEAAVTYVRSGIA